MKEMKIINGFVKYFLPNYGPAIENLILYGSLTINDNTVRRDTHDMDKSKCLNFLIYFRHEKYSIHVQI